VSTHASTDARKQASAHARQHTSTDAQRARTHLAITPRAQFARLATDPHSMVLADAMNLDVDLDHTGASEGEVERLQEGVMAHGL